MSQSTHNAPEPLFQDDTSAWDMDIQAKPGDEIGDIVDSLVRSRRRERQQQADIDTEARIRDLLQKTKPLLAVAPDKASLLLEEVHYTLRRDDDHETALRHLDDVYPDDKASQTASRFQRQARLRDHPTRSRPPNPTKEYKTLSRLGVALNYFSDPSDLTRYAPVRMEALDIEGAKQARNPSVVGRRRLASDTTMDPEHAAVDIAHEDCDHILAIAKPRSGKDSTLVSLGKNLWKEHGYSYFSIFDDGRMETPMTAIPNDEQVIRDNLERMGQEPDPFDVEIYVPRTDSVPDKLPNNFVEFTLGIESLTPNLILQLSGVNTSDDTAEDRIRQALEATMENSGQVDELVQRIQHLAQSQDAVIQWTELRDYERGDGSTEQRQVTYEMERSTALKKAAQRLANLASRGIVAGTDAVTNISMEQLLKEQHKAAVLCTNFMQDGTEPLKYMLTDLWLQLIFKARDEYPRAPRACIEIRELKNLAPSKLADTNYADQIKSLRQTLFEIASQGGSRRVQMLGSTQKLNDVYKSVRSNMGVQILLRLGDEEIDTLGESFNFSHYEKQQLEEFSPGEGMIIQNGKRYYPIFFRGAPCGLGLGDLHWLDRYGLARGCRVRSDKDDRWLAQHRDEDWWVHVPTLDVYDPEERQPRVGDYYSEWYLLASDVERILEDADPAYDGSELTPALASRPLVERVLEERRDYGLRSDISLDVEERRDTGRTMELFTEQDKAERVEDVLERLGVTAGLEPWMITDNGRVRDRKVVKKFERVIRAVDNNEARTLKDLATNLTQSASSIGNYTGSGKPLGPCINMEGEYYTLTDLGQAAREVDWDEVLDEVNEVED